MDGLAGLIGDNAVIFWMIIAIVCGAIEASTAGLICVWFAIGALVTMIPAWLGWSFNAQLAVFIASSAAALVFTRPFFKRVLRVNQTPTNADMTIGQTGVVTTAIDNIGGHGRVMVRGLEWAARSSDGSKIEKGASVEVVELRGVTVTVRRTDNKKLEDK